MSLIFSHPIKKLTLAAAFGGGYVLGAKAGRDRYEQIKQTAQQVAEDPRVQQATSQAQEFVRETAEKVKEDPRVKDVADKVTSVTKQGADKVEEAVDSTKEAASSHSAGSHSAGSDSSTAAAPKPTPPPAPSSTSTDEVHPLLADEHIAMEETVVYSAGPDIEESIDELIDDKPDHA
jgi:hypothetical protein